MAFLIFSIRFSGSGCVLWNSGTLFGPAAFFNMFITPIISLGNFSTNNIRFLLLKNILYKMDIIYICFVIAGVAQLVERQPSKLNVAGSNPVSRSKSFNVS